MSLEILLSAVAVLFTGVLAWGMAKSMEYNRHQTRIGELESKVRVAQGEANKLKEQMVTVRSEVESLQRNLSEERVAKQLAVTQVTQAFQKRMMLFCAIWLFLGALSSAPISWVVASIHADAQNQIRESQRNLDANLARFKAEVLEKQVSKLTGDLEGLRGELLRTSEEKAVAQTKLEILLNSLSPRRGQGFELDPAKLRQNLDQKQGFSFFPNSKLLVKTSR